MDLVIGTRTNPAAVEQLVNELKQIPLTEATLYVGYPILHSADVAMSLDSILTCVEHGIVVFDLIGHDRHTNWEQIEERQAEVEISLKSKLFRHRELTAKRQLAVPVSIITYLPFKPNNVADTEIVIAEQGHLREALDDLPRMDRRYIKALNAAIQQVATIKPHNKRLNVKSDSSKGGRLKVIEREIANLDKWQKKGAIECPDGPQRIRGLAGSGKTVVLALKAAYLHAQHPDWTIAVGFQTQSLYEQFRDLIRRFTFEHIGDEPDWDRLKIMHAWGSSGSPGLYSAITEANGLECRDFQYAKRHFGSLAFEGVCGEALSMLVGRPENPIFDALLVDEAQDFGPNFFQFAYKSVKPPHRFVFAYDELQSLSETSLPGLVQLFGTDRHGEPVVKLRNAEGQPQQDVILPVCYRNTPWSISTAHALGFGIYRHDGLIQMFDEPALWHDIGYEVVAGSVEPGQQATLARRADATPEYFNQLLASDEALQVFRFNTRDEQAQWVADQIALNLERDELELSDILVIFANPISVPTEAGPLISKLREKGINAHIAGVTRRVDRFFISDSIVISGIYRAKGNEAAMVYVMGADFCFEGPSLTRRRNILFTAITRSRAWVRVCGIGSSMEHLQEEWEEVKRNNYSLRFTVPSFDELARIRRINRDRTEDEIQRIEQGRKSLQATIDLIERGDITLEDLPMNLRTKLSKILGRE